MSYDITGLSDGTPNAAPIGPRLTPAQQNSRTRAVDLAVGYRLKVYTPLSAAGLGRDHAEQIFLRCKKSTRLEIMDIANLCEPLHAFPYLGSVAQSKEFFKKGLNWAADEWPD